MSTVNRRRAEGDTLSLKEQRSLFSRSFLYQEPPPAAPDMCRRSEPDIRTLKRTRNRKEILT
jgi:hypothetical protein